MRRGGGEVMKGKRGEEKGERDGELTSSGGLCAPPTTGSDGSCAELPETASCLQNKNHNQTDTTIQLSQHKYTY